mgnify:FL=1
MSNDEARTPRFIPGDINEPEAVRRDYVSVPFSVRRATCRFDSLPEDRSRENVERLVSLGSTLILHCVTVLCRFCPDIAVMVHARKYRMHCSGRRDGGVILTLTRLSGAHRLLVGPFLTRRTV